MKTTIPVINHINSHWATCNRTVFMTEDFHGMVEIEYLKSEPKIGYIWQLWVDEGCRRKGYATALLDAAEEHIALQLKERAVLEWDKRNTPTAIYDWYKRRGYYETASNKNIITMEKDIQPL